MRCLYKGTHTGGGQARRGGAVLRGAHIQFAIYPGMDLSHYLAERER